MHQIGATSLERIIAAGGVVAAVAGAAVLYFIDPSKAGFLPGCPLLSMTGFACPGCGLTRGFHALLHGDITTAVGFNALIPLFVVLFVAIFISMLLTALRGRSIPFGSLKPGYVVAFLILLLGFGVVRNLPLEPFTYLYP